MSLLLGEKALLVDGLAGLLRHGGRGNDGNDKVNEAGRSACFHGVFAGAGGRCDWW